jgi:hypothetical protein
MRRILTGKSLVLWSVLNKNRSLYTYLELTYFQNAVFPILQISLILMRELRFSRRWSFISWCFGLRSRVVMRWRWRQQVPPKRWYPTATLHGVTTQKTSTHWSWLSCTSDPTQQLQRLSKVKNIKTYERVSKSFRTGCLKRELQMVQLSATRCSCIAILWVSLTCFAAMTLCVASQRVFIVVSVYFVIDSVRKLFDTPSYARIKYFL